LLQESNPQPIKKASTEAINLFIKKGKKPGMK
jgi:hypothetical protein